VVYRSYTTINSMNRVTVTDVSIVNVQTMR